VDTRNSITIRNATIADADAITQVLTQAFRIYKPLYTPAAYAATVITPGEVMQRMREGPVLIAMSDTQIAGTVSLIFRRDEVYIRGMAVDPAYGGQKIGLHLLKYIEDMARRKRAKRLMLSTTPFLERAIHRYSASGFARVAEGPGDLHGTPLFTMIKILPYD